MTATTTNHPDVPLPPGAEVSTDWDETNDEYRILSGEAQESDQLLVRPYITQLRDGSFSTDAHAQPLVCTWMS
jgi:hypothetical protein